MGELTGATDLGNEFELVKDDKPDLEFGGEVAEAVELGNEARFVRAANGLGVELEADEEPNVNVAVEVDEVDGDPNPENDAKGFAAGVSWSESLFNRRCALRITLCLRTVSDARFDCSLVPVSSSSSSSQLSFVSCLSARRLYIIHL